MSSPAPSTTSPTATASTGTPLQALAFQQPLLGSRRELVTPRCLRTQAHPRSRALGLFQASPNGGVEAEGPLAAPPVKRGRGRPKGSGSGRSAQASGRGRGGRGSRPPLSQEEIGRGRGRGHGNPERGENGLDSNNNNNNDDDGGGRRSDDAGRKKLELRELETFAEVLKSDEKDDSSRTRAVRRTIEGLESFADRLARDDLGPDGGALLRRRLEALDDDNDGNSDDFEEGDLSKAAAAGAGGGAGGGLAEQGRLMQLLLREEEADRRDFTKSRLARRRHLLQMEQQQQQQQLGGRVDMERMPFDEGGRGGPQLNSAAAARGGLLAGGAEEYAASPWEGAGGRDAEFGDDFGFVQDMDMDVDTEELPSALTLLANLDVLAGLDEEVTGSRLPFPKAEEDEETARLMQVTGDSSTLRRVRSRLQHHY